MEMAFLSLWKLIICIKFRTTMITKRDLVILLVITVLAATVHFFLKKYAAFDVPSVGFAVIMVYVVILIQKSRK